MDILQSRLLDVLLEFDEVCKRHGISYFLDCGTLLGAVRHKGFIPWDDDIDVCMDRVSYRALCTLQDKGVLGKRFAFNHWDNTDNYIWDFGKFVDVTTTLVESALAKKRVDYKSGVGLDVFVLDGGGNDYGLARKHFSRLVLYLLLRYYRYWDPDTTGKSLYKKSLLKFLAYLSHTPLAAFYKSRIKALTNKFDVDKSQYLGSAFEFMCHPGVIYRRDEIYPFSQVEFEGYKFSAPRNAHIYLTRMYGDYMTLPDPERRAPHVQCYLNMQLPCRYFDYYLVDRMGGGGALPPYSHLNYY